VTRALSQSIDKRLVDALRRKLAKGDFPGIGFDDAMKFLLTDGIVPKSDQPVESYLRLEAWVRGERQITFSATELKNKTGQVLDAVARGERVIIERHGRPLAELRRLPSGDA